MGSLMETFNIIIEQDATSLTYHFKIVLSQLDDNGYYMEFFKILDDNKFDPTLSFELGADVVSISKITQISVLYYINNPTGTSKEFMTAEFKNSIKSIIILYRKYIDFRSKNLNSSEEIKITDIDKFLNIAVKRS